MYLHRDDVIKMMEIFNKFPEVQTVKVKQDTSSGIGSHTTMTINTEINGVNGDFEIVVSSVENW